MQGNTGSKAQIACLEYSQEPVRQKIAPLKAFGLECQRGVDENGLRGLIAPISEVQLSLLVSLFFLLLHNIHDNLSSELCTLYILECLNITSFLFILQRRMIGTRPSNKKWAVQLML